MGAALPVVGAVVGIGSTVSNTVKQNQAAQRQRDALQLSKDAAALQTQQRLLGLEQKKSFVEGQLVLDNLARSQERAIAQTQLSLQEQTIRNQIQQEEFNRQANQALIQQQQGIQTGLQQIQTFSAQQQAAAQDALQRQGRNFNFLSEDAALQLGEASQLSGQAAQLRDQLAGIENQRIGVRQDVSNQLDAIAAEFQQANAQERNALRQRAISAVSLAAGQGLSQSDRALLAEQDNVLMQQAVERALRSGRTQDLLREAEKFQLGQLQQQRDQFVNDFNNQRLLSEANVGIQRGQLIGQNKLADAQAGVSSRLASLNINLPAQLQQLGIDQQAALQLNLNDIGTIKNLQQLGLDLNAINTLKTAQQNTFELGDAQAALNKQFSNLALDANRLSVQSAGAAERAAITAQQQSIQSPGAMGLLSGVAQGVGSLAGTGILSGGATTGAANPIFQAPGATPPFNPTSQGVDVTGQLGGFA